MTSPCSQRSPSNQFLDQYYLTGSSPKVNDELFLEAESDDEDDSEKIAPSSHHSKDGRSHRSNASLDSSYPNEEKRTSASTSRNGNPPRDYYQLLIDEPLPVVDTSQKEPSKSCWRGRVVQVLSLVGVGASIAGLVESDSSLVQATCAGGIGFLLQTLIDSTYGPKYISKVHGAIQEYYANAYIMIAAEQILSNLGVSDLEDHVRLGIYLFVISSLGSLFAMWRKQAMEHHFLARIENESVNMAQPSSREVFRDVFIPRYLSDPMMFITAALAGVALYYSEDPAVSDVLKFCISHQTCGFAGGRIADFVLKKIEEAGSENTCWRNVKIGLSTSAVLIAPLSFLPVGSSSVIFPTYGALIGFLDNSHAQFVEKQIKSIPISELEELEPSTKSTIRRVLEAAIPIFLFLGFEIWQMGWGGLDADAKTACSLYMGSIALTHLVCAIEHKVWDREKRISHTGELSICQRVRDFFKVKITYDPRVIGMTISNFFFTVTSAMKMNNRALLVESANRKAMVNLGYVGLGTGAALEYHRISKNGVWVVLPSVALFLGGRWVQGFLLGDKK